MERGYTLAELTIVVAIVAALLAGGAFALGHRPLSVSTGITQFDAQVQAARSLAASSGNGATLVIVSTASGGFRSTLYAGRPDAALTAANVPPVESAAALSEDSVGTPPFTIFVSSGGDFSVASGSPAAAAAEPPCPAAGNLHLVLADPSTGSGSLDLPCRVPAAGTPIPVATPPLPQ